MVIDPKDIGEENGLILFGRDLSKIPCFRDSFLYGIGGGLAFGLVHFICTSKSVKSLNYSVYSMCMITMGYWIQCRYEYSKSKSEAMRMRELIERGSMFEGSEQVIPPPVDI
ncbi:cytochrome c oxidase assembly protein COX20, mitochondrial [Cylas formicarius]|uniref:cytochrome c oxidase assembly protein COX20, mitochondrial n=1 Tax=Cylas formicarius TaxID=197179 RepID=UPI0029586E31|nr:cytochrome c oxidase assembly protein COX20, mitochondrial [Cylas formicarius]